MGPGTAARRRPSAGPRTSRDHGHAHRSSGPTGLTAKADVTASPPPSTRTCVRPVTAFTRGRDLPAATRTSCPYDWPLVSTLVEWTESVCRELGIEDLVDVTETTKLVLDLARDVAHGVARPAAPLTAYLLGVAAGRTADPRSTSAELAARIQELAESWGN